MNERNVEIREAFEAAASRGHRPVKRPVHVPDYAKEALAILYETGRLANTVVLFEGETHLQRDLTLVIVEKEIILWRGYLRVFEGFGLSRSCFEAVGYSYNHARYAQLAQPISHEMPSSDENLFGENLPDDTLADAARRMISAMTLTYPLAALRRFRLLQEDDLCPRCSVDGRRVVRRLEGETRINTWRCGCAITYRTVKDATFMGPRHHSELHWSCYGSSVKGHARHTHPTQEGAVALWRESLVREQALLDQARLDWRRTTGAEARERLFGIVEHGGASSGCY